MPNWAKFVIQIEVALLDYELGKTLLQLGAAELLQIRTTVVTSWDNRYYKMGHQLQIALNFITN